MLTFNESGKTNLIGKLEAHAKVDAFVQGDYWDTATLKGCAVGCTLVDYGVSTSEHSQYEKLFGIPQVLAKLEDRIFEGLTLEHAKLWPLRFANAIPVNTDLSGVWPKFQIFILTDPEHGVIRFAKTDELKSIITDIAELFFTWPEIDKEKAMRLRRAAAAYAAAAAAADAYAAAYAADAAYAAAYAAYADAAAAAYAAAAAAAYAAYADAARQNHYLIMSNKLIELIEAA